MELFRSLHYSRLGLIHLDLKEYDIAQECLEKSLELALKNKEKTNEGSVWFTLGRVLGKKEPAEYSKAEEYILRGIKMASELNIRPHLSQGYLYLGDLYNQIGRKDEALNTLRKAEGMFKEMEMDYFLNKTQETLTKL